MRDEALETFWGRVCRHCAHEETATACGNRVPLTQKGAAMLRFLLTIAAVATATSALCQKPSAKPAKSLDDETPAQFAARTKWWREAKFGMFIHWGVYAVPADSTTRDGRKAIAEWYFSNKQMQMADYEKFAPQFNPAKFDAHKWVATA